MTRLLEELDEYEEVAAREVTCPYCEVQPGYPCVSRGFDHPVRRAHVPRIKRALELRREIAEAKAKEEG